MFVLMQILPSPTTGAFAAQSNYNWMNNSEGNQQMRKENFSFQTQQQGPAAVTASTTTFQSSTVGGVQQVCCNQFYKHLLHVWILCMLG